MMKIQHSLLLLVACAALHLVLAASSSSSSPSPSLLTQNLIDWIRTREGGIYNPKQEENTFDESNSNARGIFASEDIAEGEILLKVPWDSIIGAKGATHEVMIAEYQTKANAKDYAVTECRMVRDLYNEVQKGEASDFAPHLRYLSLLDNDKDETNEHFLPVTPSLWSEEGRDLLEDINDHGVLPPHGLFTTLNHDWMGACIEDIQNNPLEAKVAAVVAAHGTSGTAYSEFGILVPLFDNYHYNQRLEKQKEDQNEEPSEDNHDSANAKGIVDYGESFRLVATRPIQKGEHIYRPFGNFDHTSFTTPGIFRSHGIADAMFYPKFYEFAFPVDNEEELFVVGIEVDEDFDNGSGSGFHVKIEIYDEDDAQQPEKVIEFFEQELNWLQRLKAVVSSQSRFPEHGTMKKNEWDTAWLYHRNLVTVMQLTLEELRSDEEETNYDCPGGYTTTQKGTCPLWDGFDYLPSSMPMDDLTLEFNEDNPYGPTEDAYAMCNVEDVHRWTGYVKAGDKEVIQSQYQAIRFFTDPQTKDMVMKLDDTVQQSSSYRPHYHEFAVHFPARFLESVKRVLFVGGGDSMVLHEVLKYPSLEKVVGLELDQYVLRNSFRYFDTQPHFDDKRVEWWFGDGAKSLLMLPKDYFQSFDLVVVDLSETVMSFQVTNKLSIFQTLGLLLKPDGILLKNGEYYMDKMSLHFDYTLQYFEFDVPFICDQGMVIGSNKIDFFNRTLKDHGVELLVLEAQDEINTKFHEYYRFTEYRKNDARKQGHCGEEDFDDEEGGRNAGILMVVEAENVTHDLKSLEGVEMTIAGALKNIGFSIVSTVKHEPSIIVIVTKEGYVTARLYPETSYVGLDIQLWANFDLMEPARDALIQSLGGTEEGTSSFRIVTGGMSGSPFQESDRSKIGPRMANFRDCEPATTSSPASDGNKSVNLVESGLKGSLEIAEDGIVAVVICGSKSKECKSLDILKKTPQSKFKTIVPVNTCESMQDESDEFSPDVAERMAVCELELSDALGSIGEKISLLVVDDSAEHATGTALLSIFTSVWNRKRLFSQHRFVALVDSTTDSWRRSLLLLIREKIVYKPMSLVDVVVEDSTDKAKLLILSLHDPDFFVHLKEMVETFNEANGEAANMEVESVFDGLAPPQIGHFNPKIFLANDYDPIPAQEQLAGQKSFGRQSLVQFEINTRKYQTMGRPVITSVLESALTKAISSKEDLQLTTFEDDTSIGNGSISVAFSSDGATHAILSWDGKSHVGVNLFSGDESPKLRQKFIDTFVRTLKDAIPATLTLSDTHPRGTGRVVSFPGHMN